MNIYEKISIILEQLEINSSQDILFLGYNINSIIWTINNLLKEDCKILCCDTFQNNLADYINNINKYDNIIKEISLYKNKITLCRGKINLLLKETLIKKRVFNIICIDISDDLNYDNIEILSMAFSLLNHNGIIIIFNITLNSVTPFLYYYNDIIKVPFLENNSNISSCIIQKKNINDFPINTQLNKLYENKLNLLQNIESNELNLINLQLNLINILFIKYKSKNNNKLLTTIISECNSIYNLLNKININEHNYSHIHLIYYFNAISLLEMNDPDGALEILKKGLILNKTEISNLYKEIITKYDLSI